MYVRIYTMHDIFSNFFMIYIFFLLTLLHHRIISLKMARTGFETNENTNQQIRVCGEQTITTFEKWKTLSDDRRLYLHAKTRNLRFDVDGLTHIKQFWKVYYQSPLINNINWIVSTWPNKRFLSHGMLPLSGHDDVALFEWRRLWRWINTNIKKTSW